MGCCEILMLEYWLAKASTSQKFFKSFEGASMGIHNQYQLTANIASSGQPREDQFKAIAEAGYDIVINLAMPDSDHAIANEGSIVTSLGMTYIHIPVPFDAPSEDHYTAFSDVMTAFCEKKFGYIASSTLGSQRFCFVICRRTEASRPLTPKRLCLRRGCRRWMTFGKHLLARLRGSFRESFEQIQ